MWNRADYDRAGQTIGTQFVESNGERSINELSMKVAEDNNLNEEGIRTLVRLATVSAFEGLFSKMGSDGAEDRMINFEVGDPETVILALHKKAAQESVPSNTDDYCQTYDLYADIPKENIEVNTEKTASVSNDIPKENNKKTIHPALLKQRYKEAAERLNMEQAQQEVSWDLNMEKAASVVKYNLTNKEYLLFEKNAAATLDDDKHAVELYALAQSVGIKDSQYNNVPEIQSNMQKIANTHSFKVLNVYEEELIKYIKLASAARNSFEVAKNSKKWINKELKKLGNNCEDS